MQVRADAGAKKRRKAAREHRPDYARQDVTTSCGGEPRRAGCDEQRRTVGVGDDGRRALQQHRRTELPGERSNVADAVRAGRSAGQPRELPVMWREDRRSGPAMQYRGGVLLAAEHVQRVGVEHNRHRRLLKYFEESLADVTVASEPRACHECATAIELGEDHTSEARALEADRHRLDHPACSWTDTGRGDTDHPCPGADRAVYGELWRPAHPRRAGEYEHGALPLVRRLVA